MAVPEYSAEPLNGVGVETSPALFSPMKQFIMISSPACPTTSFMKASSSAKVS